MKNLVYHEILGEYILNKHFVGYQVFEENQKEYPFHSQGYYLVLDYYDIHKDVKCKDEKDLLNKIKLLKLFK